MKTIIKVQVAIMPPGAPALIYDKDRAHTTQQYLPKAVRKALKGDLKGYFDGSWVENEWFIGKRVKDEDW
jgi:hypothetical protein